MEKSMSTTILTHGVRLARKRTLTFSQLRIFGFFWIRNRSISLLILLLLPFFSRFSCWGDALQNKKA